MDPVMATRTLRNLPPPWLSASGRGRRHQTATGACRHPQVLPRGSGVSSAGPTYRGRMTHPTEFPTPREGLDNGSLTELCIDGGEVHVDVSHPREWNGQHREIEVPDDASSLLEGIDAYGA
jgi:hypothetical protein